jgi:hypothetical protein
MDSADEKIMLEKAKVEAAKVVAHSTLHQFLGAIWGHRWDALRASKLPPKSNTTYFDVVYICGRVDMYGHIATLYPFGSCFDPNAGTHFFQILIQNLK